MTARLQIITGKGGVGKTTVATAWATALARCGKRVLLAEFSGGDRAAALLGADPVGHEMREVLEGLFVVDIDPEEAIREYALQVVKFEAVYSAVFQNQFIRHFLRLVPSLRELVMLGKLWFHHQEQGPKGAPRFDIIVLDAPATGHALTLLQTPELAQQSVPPGPLRDNARKIAEMLRVAAELNIVTTPEEMPVSEALEIQRAADGLLQMRVGTTVLNRRTPMLDPTALDRIAQCDNEFLATIGQTLLERNRKTARGERQLRRLPDTMMADALTLPKLMTRGGIGLLPRLVDAIEKQQKATKESCR